MEEPERQTCTPRENGCSPGTHRIVAAPRGFPGARGELARGVKPVGTLYIPPQRDEASSTCPRIAAHMRAATSARPESTGFVWPQSRMAQQRQDAPCMLYAWSQPL